MLFASKQCEGTRQPASFLLVMHTATSHVERRITITWSLNVPLQNTTHAFSEYMFTVPVFAPNQYKSNHA